MLSCPDGWDVNVNDLVHQSTDGKCAIYSALKELTEYGYYKKIAIRDEKSRIIRWESTVSELPMDELAQDEHVENENSNITTDYEYNEKITHNKDAAVDVEKAIHNHNDNNIEIAHPDDKLNCLNADFPYFENQKVGKTEIENREDNKKQNIAKNDGSNIKKYCASNDARSTFEKFFEKIWQLYPRKRGKAKVSVKQKKHLCELGEELLRAIERYKAELEIESWKQAQNGDTFFNKGYIDYLDNNYIPLTPKQPNKAPKNAFHNFEQRMYDWDALETLFLTTSVY